MSCVAVHLRLCLPNLKTSLKTNEQIIFITQWCIKMWKRVYFTHIHIFLFKKCIESFLTPIVALLHLIKKKKFKLKSLAPNWIWTHFIRFDALFNAWLYAFNCHYVNASVSPAPLKALLGKSWWEVDQTSALRMLICALFLMLF